MIRQVVFALALLVTLGVFAFTIRRIVGFFKLTRPGFPVKQIGKRFGVMLKVAFGQTKIFRRPLIGLAHALVFWGFCIILFGSIEMVIDGLAGTDKSLSFLGGFYGFLMGSGDIFAYIVAIAVIIFLVRRIFLHIRRFEGIEMKRKSHIDAIVALSLILLLMISLAGMNTGYAGGRILSGEQMKGAYPVSAWLAGLIGNKSPESMHTLYEVCWWTHILSIFVFANVLPYSKHFHVFLSVPNVFLSRLEPLGKLTNMDNVTREVRLMMNPETAFAAAPSDVTRRALRGKGRGRCGLENILRFTFLHPMRTLHLGMSGKHHGQEAVTPQGDDGSQGKDEGKGTPDDQERQGLQRQ